MKRLSTPITPQLSIGFQTLLSALSALSKSEHKSKKRCMSIRFLSHYIDNRVFEDNSVGGQWIKGGQKADNTQTNEKLRFF